MWPNNGFGNGQTPEEFFDPSFLPPFPMFPTQEDYFPQMMNNVPSPEAAQFAQNQTQGPFTQNQNFPLVQFNASFEIQNTPSPAPAGTPRPASQVQLGARAAELREKLMKTKDQRRGTPTAAKTGVLGQPPANIPLGDRANGVPPQAGQEQDLETMISELSNAAQVPDISSTGTSKPATRSTPQPTGGMSSARQSSPSSSASVPDASANNLVAGQARTNGTQHRQSRGASEMSEGEILDEPLSEPLFASMTEPKPHPAETMSAVTKDVAAAKAPVIGFAIVSTRSPVQRKASVPKSPGYEKLRRLPLHGNKTNGSTLETRDRQEEPSKAASQPAWTTNKTTDTVQRGGRTTLREAQIDREIHAPPSRRVSPEHGSVRENQPLIVANNQQKEAVSPLFLQVLRDDRDLDDWLRITGYYNTEYRTGILTDRRELEVLEAHRNKLLEKMAKSERPPPHLGQSPLVSAPVSQPSGNALTIARDNAQSNKRPYHEISNVRRGSFSDKAPRLDDRRDERPRSGHADQGPWRDDRDRRSRRSRSGDRYESPTRHMESRRYSYDESRQSEGGQPYEKRPYQGGRNFSNCNLNRGRGGRGRGGGRGGY